jgi:predicted Zn-dependent protease
MVLALAILTAPGHAQQITDIENIGARNINAGLNFFVPDLETEISMGRQVAAELEQRTPRIDDPLIHGYIDRLVQTIVRNSDAVIPFSVKVIDDNSVNAFALPGGFLYLTRGLIAAAESEAELAGLIAHQIAHITARHAMELQGRAALVNIATIPSTLFLNGVPAQVVQQALGAGVPITFTLFARAAEEEADFLGLQYMVKAGYDPAAMLRFFERIQSQEEVRLRISPLFATHPQPADRVRIAEEHIANLPAAGSDFETVRDRLREMNR